MMCGDYLFDASDEAWGKGVALDGATMDGRSLCGVEVNDDKSVDKEDRVDFLLRLEDIDVGKLTNADGVGK